MFFLLLRFFQVGINISDAQFDMQLNGMNPETPPSLSRLEDVRVFLQRPGSLDFECLAILVDGGGTSRQ
ncbi:hypothetical protein KC19_2G021600 [Ceratodon purpureus]|uniref:Uncharacterized protein n=1 Tax=Ceratodon purpureus TaxID=3225 RepID=A0A8T0ISC0_CERPU|nr:hypothetical protein KC19_2G021600 [Ceratodon purpureus]